MPPVPVRVYVVPPPVMVTEVALVALTVRVEEPPAVIVDGLAVMLTIGAAGGVTVTVAVADLVPPAPVAVAV